MICLVSRGRQPPPSALYRRTWSALRSAWVLATLSCVTEQRALGVEHGLEVDQAAAVALGGQQRGAARPTRSRCAGAAGARGRRAARRARLRLPAARSAPPPGSRRAPARAPASCERTCARAAPPSNKGTDTLASRALTSEAPPVSELSAMARQAQRAAEVEARVTRRIGLRHARQRGGAPAARRRARRGAGAASAAGMLSARSSAGSGIGRHRVELALARRWAPGRSARASACWVCATLVSSAGMLRPRLLGGGARLRQLQRGDQPGLHAPLGDLQGLQLAGEVARARCARRACAPRSCM